jgi:glucosamine--fructose-6-phosphate aminotransferase (isomerizing)
MCGIVGYVGQREAQPILLEGLRRLEYRGYDSSGVAIAQEGALAVEKAVGKLAALAARLAGAPRAGCAGIGHTRWATHGAPTEPNAHPHLDAAGRVAVVHNGIIENYAELRRELQTQGTVFRSETDTEVLPHLIARAYRGDLVAAVRAALGGVRGSYALAVMHAADPGQIVVARKGSPLIIGVGEGEAFVASDAPAMMHQTRDVIYLEEGDIASVRADAIAVEDLLGQARRPAVDTVAWTEGAAEKANFPHFMLKEIHEQPEVIRHQLLTYTASGEVQFPEARLDAAAVRGLRRIVVVACGTAWHAGLVGKALIERFARIPVEVDLASEFRYGARVLGPDTLVLAVTQSGETADTLEAARLARREDSPVLAVVNVPGSSIAREADGVIHTLAGPEIGVASTKAYTSQIAALALLALRLGRLRGALDEARHGVLLNHLRDIPDKLHQVLERQDLVRRCATEPRFLHARNAMFIGRGFNYPSALEGALKLKEISYIHVEGYAAGEMKHGPIALVDEALPVVCIAVRGEVYEKVISNIEEVRARGGIVLGIATEGDPVIAGHSDAVLRVPDCLEAFSPIVVALPLQLFAYHVANGLGRDVDQPRNLAKSVTVE